MKFERYLIVFLIIAATVVLSFFVPPFIAAFLIPAVCFGVLLLGNPRLFLYVYLFVMAIYPLLKDNIPLAPIKYLNELMSVLLFGLFLVHLALRRLDFRAIKKWKFGFGFFCGYVALIWLMNRGTPRGALQTIFNYFSFVPFYILSVNFLTRRDLRPLVLGSIGVFWINFFLNITWLLNINPLRNDQLYISNIADAAIGTFSGCNFVAYFCAMLFFILFFIKVRKVDVLGKRQNGLINATLIALFIQLYLTYTNHAYLYFALAFIPYAAVSGLWRKWQAVAGIVLFIVAVAITFSISEDLQVQFSGENLRHRKETLAYSAKVQLLDDLLVRNMSKDTVVWAFGVGPGNGMGPLGKDNLTPFALKMLLPYYQSVDMLSAQMTSITGNTSSAVFTLWGDYGIVGFLLFLGIYVRLIFLSFYRLRHGSEEKKCIAGGLIGAISMFLITNITFDILIMSFFTCWLWMFAALLTLPEEEAAMVPA